MDPAVVAAAVLLGASFGAAVTHHLTCAACRARQPDRPLRRWRARQDRRRQLAHVDRLRRELTPPSHVRRLDPAPPGAKGARP